MVLFLAAATKPPDVVSSFHWSIPPSVRSNISVQPLYARTVLTHTHNRGCVHFSLFSRGWWFPLCFFFLLISLLCPSNLHFRDAAPSYLAHISTNIAPFLPQLKEEIKCNVCLEGQCVCIDSMCWYTAFVLVCDVFWVFFFIISLFHIILATKMISV